MNATAPYVMLPIDILEAQDLSPTAKVVWCYLRHKQGRKADSWPSLEKIGRELGISKSAAGRAVTELEKAGLLSITRAEKRGPGHHLRYTVNGPSTGQLGKKLSQNRAIVVPPVGSNKNQEQEPTSLSVSDVWNSHENLPAIRTMTQARKTQLAVRMREPLFADNWREIVARIAGSSFCTGENDRGWKADIDWLLKNDGNYSKVLEGKYDAKHGKRGNGQSAGQSESPLAGSRGHAIDAITKKPIEPYGSTEAEAESAFAAAEEYDD